jgi:hypothetical protein
MDAADLKVSGAWHAAGHCVAASQLLPRAPLGPLERRSERGDLDRSRHPVLHDIATGQGDLPRDSQQIANDFNRERVADDTRSARVDTSLASV